MKILFLFLVGCFVIATESRAETVHLSAVIMPVHCVVSADSKVTCDGPQLPGPDSIELDHFVQGRGLDIATGTWKRQLEVGDETAEISITVRKRSSHVFNVDSFEVEVSVLFAGSPQTETSVRIETSLTSVPSTLRDLQGIRFSGPRKIVGDQYDYPLIILGPPRS